MQFTENVEFLKPITTAPSVFDSTKNFIRYLIGSRPGPESLKLSDNRTKKSTWAVYFCYNPNGVAHPQNIYMLERLRDEGIGILTVVGSQRHHFVDNAFSKLSDILIWKSVDGFDISALKIGLKYLATHHEGSDVIWINDSVFGPFHEIKAFLRKCDGDYSVLGMTQSYAVRPHFQSYAFFLRNISTTTIQALFPWTLNRCLDTHLSNVLVFETMMAANFVKSGHKVVCWANPINRRYDLTMAYPYELIDAGFPFLKRSIVGKFSSGFDQDRAADFFARMHFEHNVHQH